MEKDEIIEKNQRVNELVSSTFKEIIQTIQILQFTDLDPTSDVIEFRNRQKKKLESLMAIHNHYEDDLNELFLKFKNE